MIYVRIKKIIAVMLMAAMVGSVSGCSPKESEQEKPLSAEIFALDTVISLSVWGVSQETLDGAVAQCYQYEKLLSRTIEGSDVYRINHSKGEYTEVSEDTVMLVRKSIEFSEASDGYFDITISPVKDLWDFKAENPAVPARDTIDKELARVGYRNIEIEGNRIRMKSGAQIDLGAVAKGYIADKIAEYLRAEGVEKAILNLGGNIVMVGEKEEGIPWTVGIKNPDGGQNEYIATVDVKDASVVTSGVYERFFEVDSVIYHHLLDPFTGYPVQNKVKSVTIVSQSSLDGDILSTTCFVLGPEKGLQLIESMEGAEAVYIMEDKSIIKSSGIEKYSFKIQE